MSKLSTYVAVLCFCGLIIATLTIAMWVVYCVPDVVMPATPKAAPKTAWDLELDRRAAEWARDKGLNEERRRQDRQKRIEIEQEAQNLQRAVDWLKEH